MPWVVLPTFNEAENVERIVAAIVAVLEAGGTNRLSRAHRR